MILWRQEQKSHVGWDEPWLGTNEHPTPASQWPRSQPGTSARQSQSCRCTQVGSRGVEALGAQTPRSPSCSAERCRGGTCIPVSQSLSAGGPAAGRGGRAGTSHPEIQQGTRFLGLNPHPAGALTHWGPPSLKVLLPSPVCSWSRAGTHHMDNVEGEDLDAAHNSRERADDGGEDSQAADAEEEILGRSGVSCGHPESVAGCVAAPPFPSESPTLSATRMLRQSGLGNMVSISLCRLQDTGRCSERAWQQTHKSLSWGQGTP